MVVYVKVIALGFLGAPFKHPAVVLAGCVETRESITVLKFKSIKR